MYIEIICPPVWDSLTLSLTPSINIIRLVELSRFKARIKVRISQSQYNLHPQIKILTEQICDWMINVP